MGIGALASKVSGAIDTAMGRQDGQKDPVPAYAFAVEIDGIVEASFTQCSGFSVTREVTPIKEGGRNDEMRWLPSGWTFGKITLHSGITYSDALWSWFKEGSSDAKVKIRNVAILQMIPYTQTVVRRYDLTDCMVSQWSGPSLNSGSNEAAIETIELAFRKFALTKGT